MIKTALGDFSEIARVTFFIMPALVLMRSSRLMPGFLGIPAVIMTISDPALAS